MALYGVGKNEITIICGKRDGSTWKLVAIGEVTIARSANSVSTLQMTVRRNEITPECGDTISFTLDREHDMFLGYVTKTSKHSKTVDITAQDQMFYLNKNTYTQNFGTLTASDLIVRMADDFGFNMADPPNVYNTEYPIPDVIMQNQKPLDVLIDALNITYEHTKKRFYVYDAYSNLCLDWDENPDTLKVCTLELNHFNLKNYNFDETIEDLFNVIKVISKNENGEESVYTLENETSIRQFGRLEKIIEAGDGENPEEIAKNFLEEKERVNESFSVSNAIGDPRVFGGSSVFLNLYDNGLEDQREFLKGWYKVEAVTHKFSNATHYMDLDISLIEMEDDWNG